MADFCGENLGLHFLFFVAEIKLSISSWLVKNFSSRVSLLATEAFIFGKKNFVIFPLGFSLLGVAENVEKNIVSC